MTEYPEYKVICGDAIEVMREMPDESVNHVICDPPYAARVNANMRGNRGTSEVPYNDSSNIVTRDPGFSPMTYKLRRAVCEEACRIATGWLVFCSDWESIHEWKYYIEESGGSYRRVIPWIRWSTPQFNGQAPPTGSEAIVVAKPIKRGRKWGNGARTHYDTKCLRSNSKLDIDRPKHSTEKPVGLMKAIVEDCTKPGDLILDPFAGSSSTGVAALELGRRVILVEKDPKWAEISRQRCENVYEKLYGNR